MNTIELAKAWLKAQGFTVHVYRKPEVPRTFSVRVAEAGGIKHYKVVDLIEFARERGWEEAPVTDDQLAAIKLIDEGYSIKRTADDMWWCIPPDRSVWIPFTPSLEWKQIARGKKL